jgi:hypothetical protein
VPPVNVITPGDRVRALRQLLLGGRYLGQSMPSTRSTVEVAARRLGLRVVWAEVGPPMVFGEDVVIVSANACFQEVMDYLMRLGPISDARGL